MAYTITVYHVDLDSNMENVQTKELLGTFQTDDNGRLQDDFVKLYYFYRNEYDRPHFADASAYEDEYGKTIANIYPCTEDKTIYLVTSRYWLSVKLWYFSDASEIPEEEYSEGDIVLPFSEGSYIYLYEGYTGADLTQELEEAMSSFENIGDFKLTGSYSKASDVSADWQINDVTYLDYTDEINLAAQYRFSQGGVAAYFKNGNDLLRTDSGKAPFTVTMPEIPVYGYTFSGWKVGKKTYTVGSKVTISEDTVFQGIYEPKKVKVVYQDDNDEVLQILEHEYGEDITVSLQQCEIDFADRLFKRNYKIYAWSLNKITSVTPIQYTDPLYKDITNTPYFVKFYGYNNELVKKETVYGGNSATAPDVPSVIDNKHFVGWNRPFDYIDDDIEVHAIYKEVFVVTFIDWNGVEYAKRFVEKGQDTALPENPIRNGYKFNGWDKTLTNVQADIVTVAQYIDNKSAMKELFKNSCFKQIEITCENQFALYNEDVVSESIQITQSLSEGNQLKFGKCNANELQFKTFRTDINYKNKKLNVKLYIPDLDDYLYLGTYFVVSDKFSEDRGSKTIIAYDRLYELNNYDITSFYHGLFSGGIKPTFKQVRDKLFEKFDISQPNVELPLDNVEINFKDVQSMSGQQLLEAICEANGCFGSMSLGGVFSYIFPSLDTGNPDFTLTIEDYYKTSHEDYYVQKVSMLQIDNGDTVGHFGENISNLYSIKNNVLLVGKTEEELNSIAKTIFNKIKDIQYCPFSLSMYGQPWLEVGDSIKVTTFNSTYNSIVLKRVISGVVGLQDSYEGKGNEIYSEELNLSKTKTEQAERKADEAVEIANKVEAKVQDVSTEVETIKGNMYDIRSVTEVPSKPQPMTIYFVRRKK